MHRLIALFLATRSLAALTAPQQDYTQYVDTFYGTEGGGNMFPGVVPAPFSVAKIGPDVVNNKSEAYSGYLSSGNITGFSMLHESGTGGAPKYGVVSQLPLVGKIANPLVNLAVGRTAKDNGTVGYYVSKLNNGVTVELAGTSHAGLFQYTYPANQSTNVLVDVSHVLPSFRGMGWSQAFTGGTFNYVGNGSYEGSGTYNNGWNLAPDWTIYFCGRFEQTPAAVQTFIGDNVTLKEFGQHSQVTGSGRIGALFTFGDATVKSRVGISWTSTAKACQYVDSEIPAGTTLDALVAQSKAVWNTEVFSKMTSSDTNKTILGQLYSNLYGMHLMPSNRTGDNPAFESTEPYYDDFFTLWDLFRCTTPLYHVLQPKMYEEMVRSIIDIWRHEGYMPDARSSNFNGRTQGGSNADVVLADAYVKGVRGAVNWNDAYSAMKTDAEIAPPPNHDKIAPDSSTKDGRGALPDWIKHGYITPKYTRAVTRAVEYAGNDFGLYQVAKGLGKTNESIAYLQRSRNWRNHFNPKATSFNVSGFLVPRNANGSFVKQNPMSCDGCYWKDPYYEAKPWEYTMNAHHDLAWLVKADGNDTFVKRLNVLMNPKNNIFNAGNEPSFTTPYLYNFVNQQSQSVKQSRTVAKTQYGPGLGGLPGNSDAGAMQSWLLWNMIGLYPVTGQTTFLIGSPWFSNLNISLPNGKSVAITSTGGNSDSAYYVQSLKVNGRQWNQNWITWDDVFANGGTLDFQLGKNATNWDANGDLPPSPATNKQSESDSGQAATMPNTSIGPMHDGRMFHSMHNSTSIALGVSLAVAIPVSALLVLFLWKLGVFGKKTKTADATIEGGNEDKKEDATAAAVTPSRLRAILDKMKLASPKSSAPEETPKSAPFSIAASLNVVSNKLRLLKTPPKIGSPNSLGGSEFDGKKSQITSSAASTIDG